MRDLTSYRPHHTQASPWAGHPIHSQRAVACASHASWTGFVHARSVAVAERTRLWTRFRAGPICSVSSCTQSRVYIFLIVHSAASHSGSPYRWHSVLGDARQIGTSLYSRIQIHMHMHKLKPTVHAREGDAASTMVGMMTSKHQSLFYLPVFHYVIKHSPAIFHISTLPVTSSL